VIVHFTDNLSPLETVIPVSEFRSCTANILVVPSVVHSPFDPPSGPLNIPDCIFAPVELLALKSNGSLDVSKTTPVLVPVTAGVNDGTIYFLTISPSAVGYSIS